MNTVSEYIASMDKTDEVCLKGVESNRGFNASVASLNQCLTLVISAHQNSRGTKTLVLSEENFKKLARQHGYNI